MTDQVTPEPLTDNELAAIRTHTRAYLPSTEDAPILVEAATDRRRLLDEVDRLRAQLDRAKSAAAWERGQRRSQSSTLGVKIDQLGIARAEQGALAARLAAAEQARDEARAQLALVRDFIDARSIFVWVLRQYVPEDMTDYHRWTGHAEARRVLAEDLGLTLDPETGGLASHEPATATGAPDPDPSEGTAPNGRTGGTQGPHEAPCLDSPAPLTLDQAATALYDWAGDLDDGARTDWPAGHADVIRGIRAAADWLDARSAYETEAREQHLAEPTLRDVMAAAYRAGLGVRRLGGYGLDDALGEPIMMCREWVIIGAHGREVGYLTIRRAAAEATVEIESRGAHPQALTNPTPAEILTAARLAGLIGGTDA